MNKLNFEIKDQYPLRFTCTGENFENTKSLTLPELILYLEKDFRKLEKENHWLELSIDLSIKKNSHLECDLIEVFISTKRLSSFKVILNDIEKIIWGYNKQILVQNGGRFYSEYNRLEYIIHRSYQTKIKQIA